MLNDLLSSNNITMNKETDLEALLYLFSVLKFCENRDSSLELHFCIEFPQMLNGIQTNHYLKSFSRKI